MAIITGSEQPFGSLARQMGKIADQLGKGFYSFCPHETWTPSVNLYETDAAYIVCVDLAGVEREKIDITVVDQRLTLRGHRPAPVPQGPHSKMQVRVHLMEIDHGAFVREVELPADVDRDAITASHRNGLLWIELPKK
jgi:HSP20 family protein